MARPDGPAHAGRGRAQSEVIGFALVFTTVLLATTGVVFFGITALEEVQETAISDSSERAIEAVGGDLEALYQGTATSRTTEAIVEAGSLETGSSTTVTVTAQSNTITNRFRPVVYDGDSAQVVYENSLIVRDQRNGAVALNRVLGTYTPERTIFPVIKTKASPQSVGGGTQQVRMVRESATGHLFTGSNIDVVIEIDGLPESRAAVWKRALNREIDPGMSIRSPDPACYTPSDDEVQCEFETDTLVVSVVTIAYGFQ